MKTIFYKIIVATPTLNESPTQNRTITGCSQSLVFEILVTSLRSAQPGYMGYPKFVWLVSRLAVLNISIQWEYDGIIYRGTDRVVSKGKGLVAVA